MTKKTNEYNGEERGSVYQHGNKWYYSFYIGLIDGKESRERGICEDCSDRISAAHYKDQKVREYDSGGVFKITSENVTCHYLFDEWMKSPKFLSYAYNTRTNYSDIVSLHILPTLGKYKVKSITTMSLQSLVNEKAKKLGYTSMKNICAVLSNAFKYAVFPCQYIKDNPALYIDRTFDYKDPDDWQEFDIEEEEAEVLTPEEYDNILARFRQKAKQYYYIIPLQIAYETGMRMSEVAALWWDVVDLKKGKIKVNKKLYYHRETKTWKYGPPKNKKSRSFLISEELVELLKDWKKKQLQYQMEYGSDYILTNHVCTKPNGEIVTKQTLKYCSKIIKRDLAYEHFHFHLLRHTFATRCSEAGANVTDIQKRLGHSHIKTTDIYTHSTESMQKDTLDKLKNL